MQELFAVGDSITLGHWDTSGGWLAHVRRASDQTVLTTMRRHYSLVYNLGVSGDTSAEALRRYPAELQARHKVGAQTFTILAIGINDSKFSVDDLACAVDTHTYDTNLNRLLDLALTPLDSEGIEGVAIVLGLTPVDEALTRPMPWKPETEYRADLVAKYNEVARQVAQSRGVPFIDLLDHFGLDHPDLHNDWDGVHPTAKGHVQIAALVHDALVNVGWGPAVREL